MQTTIAMADALLKRPMLIMGETVTGKELFRKAFTITVRENTVLCRCQLCSIT